MGNFNLLFDGISVASGIATIVQTNIMPRGYMDNLAEGEKFSDSLYATFDSMDNNMKLTTGKGLFESREDMEKTINSALEITSDKNLNPVELLEDLELLMSTGKFKDKKEAMEFDATLREMLYMEGKKTDEVNTAVSAILHGMKDKSVDFNQIVKDNFSKDLYDEIGGDDGVSEVDFQKYTIDKKEDIANLFKGWVLPPSVEEAIAQRKIDIENRIIRTFYDGVLTPEQEMKWNSFEDGKNYGSWHYEEIDGKPTFFVIPPSYKDENGVLNTEGIAQEEYQSFPRYDYGSSGYEQIAESILYNYRYGGIQTLDEVNVNTQATKDNETNAVEVNNDTPTYNPRLFYNTATLGFTQNEENIQSSTSPTTEPQSYSDIYNNGGVVDYNQEVIQETPLSLREIAKNLNDVYNHELSSSSNNEVDFFSSDSNSSYVATRFNEFLEQLVSLGGKIIDNVQEVYVYNTIEKYADPHDVIDVLAKKIQPAATILAGVTPKNVM